MSVAEDDVVLTDHQTIDGVLVVTKWWTDRRSAAIFINGQRDIIYRIVREGRERWVAMCDPAQLLYHRWQDARDASIQRLLGREERIIEPSFEPDEVKQAELDIMASVRRTAHA